MSNTRIKMTIQGSGVLKDGSKYTRKLSIMETVGQDGVVKEVSAEKIEVDGEVCEVKGVRINRTVVDEEVKYQSVSDVAKFETRWEQVNWLWSRIIGYHVPNAEHYRFGV